MLYGFVILTELLKNGDYKQSSDHLGYGEKQDDDLLHNFTVAKATIDCNIELDSPYYNGLDYQLYIGKHHNDHYFMEILKY